MFAKPKEMVLHRPHSYGGIGLQSVKYKALACYISTFMQTAANPTYRQGGTKRAAVAAPLPGNFSEKTLLAGNFN